MERSAECDGGVPGSRQPASELDVIRNFGKKKCKINVICPITCPVFFCFFYSLVSSFKQQMFGVLISQILPCYSWILSHIAKKQITHSLTFGQCSNFQNKKCAKSTDCTCGVVE